jgi:pyrroloquinoline quinone biosynthesis protein B
LESLPPIPPISPAIRRNPLEAVLLTNADLDHTLGLLMLREGEPLHLHASRPVRDTLSGALGFTSLLDAFCGAIWHELPVQRWASLDRADGKPSGLSYRALALPSPPPIFQSSSDAQDQTMAFLVRDDATGGVVLIAPDVFKVTDELAEAIGQADAVLFDGTFWSEDELATVKATARPSSAMGHLPIRDGSLELLADSPARHRIYLHINNTNPILMPDRPERQAVEKAGIAVGWDGLEFEL